MSRVSFDRIVRFQNGSGQTMYGEVPMDFDGDKFVGLSVEVYEGEAPWDQTFKKTSKKETIQKLLPPLAHIPIYVCVGVNYKAHLEEAGFPKPQYPVVFNKPQATMAGPDEDIPLHAEAKSTDYEGEFCVVIGKDCKDFKKGDDIREYVLGYTIGNDVSSRYWQAKERSGDQAGHAKGFDKFAPIGPVISSTTRIPDPRTLTVVTRVNGEQRQRGQTDDLLFGVEELLYFCSTGHTLQRGTVLMTGTPHGVGAFMNPPQWLGQGDVVEIEISKIGKLRNRFVNSNP